MNLTLFSLSHTPQRVLSAKHILNSQQKDTAGGARKQRSLRKDKNLSTNSLLWYR